jgi:nitrate reductase assembly molybdenum cofactor insertion protein NarJ
LSNYTASVTLVSGGDSTDLNSTLNVPGDYVPVMLEYIQKQLLLMKSTPKDLANDGQDLSVN